MEKEKIYTEEVNQVNDDAIFDEEDFATFEEDLDDMLSASDEEDLLETVSRREGVRAVCDAVRDRLTPQERLVIELRYGLGGGAPLRQREVAEKTGISRSYVSRVEKRALEKLRSALE